MAKDSLAFIGLGQMGFGMAKNLRKSLPASTSLKIYDVNGSSVTRFGEEVDRSKGDVVLANSPAEVLDGVSTVFTCLPNGELSTKVIVEDENSIVNVLKGENKLVVDCSTIGSQISVNIGKAIAEKHPSWEFSDAPGGPLGASKGTLTFMVGTSTPEVFSQVKDLVSGMGNPDNIFHCGRVGAGGAVKALNNYSAAVNVIACSEVFDIGIKAGIDKYTLAKIMNVSSGESWISRVNNPVPGITPGTAANNDYNGGFSIEMCRGVIGLAGDIADNVGAKMPLRDAVFGVFDETKADPRYKGKDARIVYKWMGGESGD